MKYYIDTCIWIDYWEDRKDNLKPLGEFAFNFLNKLEDEDIVYYSNILLGELQSRYSEQKIKKILSIVDDSQLVFLKYTETHLERAKHIARSGLAHTSDALHIVLAKEQKAKFVTRDKQILNSGLVDASKPEDLI